MKRICRYKDNGNYVQNSECADIDMEKLIEHRARIMKAEKKVQTLMNRVDKPKPVKMSVTQEEDKEDNYKTTMKNDQIRHM